MSKVYVSAVIDAPVDRVWAATRDFNGLPSWVPAIAKSHIEGGGRGDAVGSVRVLELQDGGLIRERLLTLSDSERSCTYSILDGPLPVANYVATFSFRPITADGRTFAEWTADFDVTEGEESAMLELIGNGVFAPGFAQVTKALVHR